jgi:V/A-type H+-transporting ATPase subunit I
MDAALEALAGIGNIEFDASGVHSVAGEIQRLREYLTHYHAAAKKFGRYWPAASFEKQCCDLPLDEAAAAALDRIEHWRQAAVPALGEMEQVRRERRELEDWAGLLRTMSGVGVDLRALAMAGPVVSGYCLLFPTESELPDVGGALQARFPIGEGEALFGIVRRADLARLLVAARARGGRNLTIPRWFAAHTGDTQGLVSARIKQLEQRQTAVHEQLGELARAGHVDRAIGVLERLDWFQQTAQHIRCDSEYCWITGWTAETDAGHLDAALREVGLQASVQFTDPPGNAPSPSLTHNPGWLQPFESLVRLFGVPGVTEVDPTTWVALLAPMLFGYMCGDVGHGLVIIAAGLLVPQHAQIKRLLVICGIASTVFGVAYGDVFGFEHYIDPLWVRPLEHPWEILVVPVVAGALILSAGILLHTVETCWQGRGKAESLADVAQMLSYWGLMLVIVDLRFGWVTVAGMVLCAGNRLWHERGLRPLLIGQLQLVESTFTLLLNTISFARVGAFAIAHSALESVVIALSDSATSVALSAAVIVLGNLFVIVMEGLLVAIQTTRLLFFEFFTRFFQGAGRPFQPAMVPPSQAGNGPGTEVSTYEAGAARRGSRDAQPPQND